MKSVRKTLDRANNVLVSRDVTSYYCCWPEYWCKGYHPLVHVPHVGWIWAGTKCHYSFSCFFLSIISLVGNYRWTSWKKHTHILFKAEKWLVFQPENKTFFTWGQENYFCNLYRVYKLRKWCPNLATWKRWNVLDIKIKMNYQVSKPIPSCLIYLLIYNDCGITPSESCYLIEGRLTAKVVLVSHLSGFHFVYLVYQDLFG